MNRLLVGALALVLALAPTVAMAKDELTPEERYELGVRYMRRGLTTKALEQFNKLRNFHRDDPISLKAELAIADMYYKKRDWEQARLAYDDFRSLHPKYPEMDFVVFRIGSCYDKRAPNLVGRDQTATRQAVNAWTGFETRYPDSQYKEEVAEHLGKARDRLAGKELAVAKFYERRDAWMAVRRRAEGMIARYPDSEHVPEATAMAAKAYHQWGMDSDAQRLRADLLAKDPDSPYLAKIDRELEKPAGEVPVDDPFPRPYRAPTSSAPNPLTGQ